MVRDHQAGLSGPGPREDLGPPRLPLQIRIVRDPGAPKTFGVVRHAVYYKRVQAVACPGVGDPQGFQDQERPVQFFRPGYGFIRLKFQVARRLAIIQ